MGDFFVGTSGWSYSDWREIFYPKEIKSGEHLEYYAFHFPVVELNASFYRLPTKHTVQQWYARTPETFFFCPKLSRLITHIKRLKGSEDLLEDFIDIFRSLKKKLGPILIQLPPGLKFESEHESFFSLLKEKYATFTFCLEARHESWMTEEVLKLLSSYGMGWVIADSGQRYPTLRAAISKTVYFRFHGPSSLYASNYKAEQLTIYVSDAKKALNEGRDVWAFFNNDFHGYAIQNAFLFKDLVQLEK